MCPPLLDTYNLDRWYDGQTAPPHPGYCITGRVVAGTVDVGVWSIWKFFCFTRGDISEAAQSLPQQSMTGQERGKMIQPGFEPGSGAECEWQAPMIPLHY